MMKNDNPTLTELAEQYRDSANKLKNWLAKHGSKGKSVDDTRSFEDIRTENIIRTMYREAAALSKYLESYYEGNRMDSRLYESLNVINASKRNDY